jgi:hypothetical protein
MIETRLAVGRRETGRGHRTGNQSLKRGPGGEADFREHSAVPRRLHPHRWGGPEQAAHLSFATSVEVTNGTYNRHKSFYNNSLCNRISAGAIVVPDADSRQKPPRRHSGAGRRASLD